MNVDFLSSLAQAAGGSFTYYQDSDVVNENPKEKQQSGDVILLVEELNSAKANLQRIVQSKQFISKKHDMTKVKLCSSH